MGSSPDISSGFRVPVVLLCPLISLGLLDTEHARGVPAYSTRSRLPVPDPALGGPRDGYIIHAFSQHFQSLNPPCAVAQGLQSFLGPRRSPPWFLPGRMLHSSRHFIPCYRSGCLRQPQSSRVSWQGFHEVVWESWAHLAIRSALTCCGAPRPNAVLIQARRDKEARYSGLVAAGRCCLVVVALGRWSAEALSRSGCAGQVVRLFLGARSEICFFSLSPHF